MYRFVSLGCDCQAAWQLRRYQASRVVHVFDDIGSRLVGVKRLLETDFAHLLRDLHPVFIEGRLVTVIDTRYRLDFTHAFHGFAEKDIARVRTEYTLKARWFRELFDEDSPPTYFIRRWDPRDGESRDDEAVELLDMLQSRRRDCRLLYLHGDKTAGIRYAPGFRSAYLQQPENGFWRGLDAAWNHAIREVAVSPYEEDGEAFGFAPRRVPRFA